MSPPAVARGIPIGIPIDWFGMWAKSRCQSIPIGIPIENSKGMIHTEQTVKE